MNEVLHSVISCINHLLVHKCVVICPWLNAQQLDYHSVRVHATCKERCDILQTGYIAGVVVPPSAFIEPQKATSGRNTASQFYSKAAQLRSHHRRLEMLVCSLSWHGTVCIL